MNRLRHAGNQRVRGMSWRRSTWGVNWCGFPDSVGPKKISNRAAACARGLTNMRRRVGSAAAPGIADHYRLQAWLALTADHLRHHRRDEAWRRHPGTVEPAPSDRG